MKVLLDHCTPAKLRHYMREHEITPPSKKGWRELSNGELINKAASTGHEVLVTADKDMLKEQNLKTLPIGLVVLTAPEWNAVKQRIPAIRKAVAESKRGKVQHVEVPRQRQTHSNREHSRMRTVAPIPEALRKTYDRVTPVRLLRLADVMESAPRTRGWTPVRMPSVPVQAPCPAPAGVDPDDIARRARRSLRPAGTGVLQGRGSCEPSWIDQRQLFLPVADAAIGRSRGRPRGV